MDATFRPARPEDAEACGKICYEAFTKISEDHNFRERIAFLSSLGGPFGAFWRMADGSGGREELMPGDPAAADEPTRAAPASFTPDGQRLARTMNDPETGRDIWVLNLADGETEPFLATRFEETAPRFSPDGRWIAYSSDESGRREVYVQAYPGPGGKWQISTEGGQEPVWNPEAASCSSATGEA